MDTDVKYKVKSFDCTMIEQFDKLLYDSWNENHIFLKIPELKLWQYQGYGKVSGMAFPVLFDNNLLIGFRGVCPQELRYIQDGRIVIDTIAIASLFLVRPEYRGQKLGLLLLQKTLEKYGNFMAIASNLKTSAPIYKKSGYSIMNEMYRYVVPLSLRYGSILLDNSVDFTKHILNIHENAIYPVSFTAEQLSSAWNNSIANHDIISLNKSTDFWSWRFLNHPVYNYLFFGGKGQGGIIVARVSSLYNDQGNELEPKVFRILEIIPEDTNVWLGNYSSALTGLLSRVLKYAQEIGCVAAEFYCTTRLFEPSLINSGMYLVADNPQLDAASYFEPLSMTVKRLSNVTLALPRYKGEADFSKVYLSLSDADQDRPNIMPNKYG